MIFKCRGVRLTYEDIINFSQCKNREKQKKWKNKDKIAFLIDQWKYELIFVNKFV